MQEVLLALGLVAFIGGIVAAWFGRGLVEDKRKAEVEAKEERETAKATNEVNHAINSVRAIRDPGKRVDESIRLWDRIKAKWGKPGGNGSDNGIGGSI